MNTTALNLNQLAKQPKTVKVKPPAATPSPAKRSKREHWTVQFMRHVDALGDELRKEGKTL